MKKKLLTLFPVIAMFLFFIALPVQATGGAVARIGDNEYPTLQDAIDAAGSNTTIITLLADTKEDIKIASEQIIELDLNGHKISNNENDDTITNSGSLTINDSQSSGIVDNTCPWYVPSSGAGSGNQRQKGSAIRNNAGAELTLNGGTYYRSLEAGNSNNPGGNSCYTLRNQGTMTINQGVVVKNSGTYSAMIGNGYYDANDNISKTYAKLIINGGTFTGGKYSIKNDDYGITEINGGTFNYSNKNWQIINYNEMHINGGTFTSENTCNIYTENVPDCEYEDGGLEITGGRFNTAGSNHALSISGSTDFVTIIGGTYNNSMVEDNWHISKDIDQDVECIPEEYAKIAVGTVDKEQYIFKVVPIDNDDVCEFNLLLGEHITINAENIRLYDIYTETSNAIVKRNATPVYTSPFETDIANIKYIADTSSFDITSKKVGETAFYTSTTETEDPDSYILTPIKVNVTMGKLYAKLDENTKDNGYTYQIYDITDSSKKIKIATGDFKSNNPIEVPVGNYLLEVLDKNGKVISTATTTVNGNFTDTATLGNGVTEAIFIVSVKDTVSPNGENINTSQPDNKTTKSTAPQTGDNNTALWSMILLIVSMNMLVFVSKRDFS